MGLIDEFKKQRLLRQELLIEVILKSCESMTQKKKADLSKMTSEKVQEKMEMVFEEIINTHKVTAPRLSYYTAIILLALSSIFFQFDLRNMLLVSMFIALEFGLSFTLGRILISADLKQYGKEQVRDEVIKTHIVDSLYCTFGVLEEITLCITKIFFHAMTYCLADLILYFIDPAMSMNFILMCVLLVFHSMIHTYFEYRKGDEYLNKIFYKILQ